MLEEEFQKEYNNLNTEQKEAVDSIDGQVMVVAGPGTGKTQIIGLRTANIILKAGINPSNILITTFTEAGVVAIRKRLIKFLGNDAYKVCVSTIHSFCQEVIKTFPEKFLHYKASTPIDDVDINEIITQLLDILVGEKVIEELTSDYDRYFYLSDIKSRISTLKQEGITIEQFKISIENQKKSYEEELFLIKPKKSGELPKKYETNKEAFEKHIKKLNELLIIYENYNTYLRENSKYDFNDMINFVLESFKNDPDLRYNYAEKFNYIMVDEYQDTNNAQNTIFDLILNTSLELSLTPNIMVVGDDDQSIYRFQGANIENMLDFSTKYPETKFIVLKNNYRSNQQILDLCTNLIQNNNERLSVRIPSINKELIANGAGKKSKTCPQFFLAQTQEEEKSFIVSKIQEFINNGIPLEEIAIITRNNREVEEYSLFLEQNSILVNSKLNTDILKNDYVLFILKFLKVLKDPYEFETDLIDILRTNILGLNQIDIFKISRALFIENYNKKVKTRFFDMFLKLEDLENIELKNKDGLLEFRDLFLDLTQQLSSLNIIEFLDYLIKKIKILEYVEKSGSFSDVEDIYTFLNKIKDFTNTYNDFNLDRLLGKINLYKKYNYSIPRQILKKPKVGVNVLTGHSSKGLEYEVVFIPSLSTGNWDNKRVVNRLKLPKDLVGKGIQEEQNPLEEERRLFFVACSRAKESLFLTFHSSKDNKIFLRSIFLEEIKNNYEETSFSNSEEIFNTSIINSLKNNLIQYKDEEFDYIEEFLENYKLSATDLNVFLEDPLLFLNNVIFKYPFIDNEATIFGKIYHRVLELFYGDYKGSGLLKDKSFLVSKFKELIYKEFLTLEQREKLLERGINGLEGFYDLYKNNQRKVAYVEYDFRSKGIFFEGVPLTGKIDKIEILGESSFSLDNSNLSGQLAFFKESIVLVDYKTGKPKSIGEIKGVDKFGNKKPGEGKYFRQLLFYKLLTEIDISLSSKYEISGLALDFVEGRDGNYKYIEIDYEKEDLESLKEEITSSRAKIKDINFWKEILMK